MLVTRPRNTERFHGSFYSKSLKLKEKLSPHRVNYVVVVSRLSLSAWQWVGWLIGLSPYSRPAYSTPNVPGFPGVSFQLYKAEIKINMLLSWSRIRSEFGVCQKLRFQKIHHFWFHYALLLCLVIPFSLDTGCKLGHSQSNKYFNDVESVRIEQIQFRLRHDARQRFTVRIHWKLIDLITAIYKHNN